MSTQSAVVDFVTSESSELVPLAKGARVAVDELRKKRVPALAVSDTDATTLRVAAIDYASNQRAYTLTNLALFERAIRSTRVTRQDVEILRDVFGPENLDLTPLQIRNELRLLFEAVIWARLYNFKPNVGPSVQVTSSEGSIDGVDDRLTQYWQVRFAEAVKRWRGEAGKSDPMDYDFQPAGVKSTWLKEYFWAIVQKTPAGGFAALQAG